jgi:hypothetical protein
VDNSIGIGDLAAILTAGGVTIYVLGLVGLAIPMWSVTKDLSTAWYATSLVPRTVVAGQGASIWLRAPLILTISMILVTLVTQAIYPNAVVYTTGIIVLLFGYYSWTRLSGGWRILGNIVVLCGTLIIGGAIDGIGSSSTLSSIIVIFVGAFIVGLPLAVIADPPLLEVRIDKQAEGSTEGVGESLRGRLVAHSGGFWHLFDENDMLLSIPDARVLSVQIPGREDTVPTVEATSANTVPQEDSEPGAEKTG